jgi:hypothetical protein
MSRKSDKGDGLSFSPEFREIVGRLKRPEPELEEMVDRETEHDREGQDGGRTDRDGY